MTLCRSFYAHTEAENLITQLDAAVTGLSGLLAAATPTPATLGPGSDVDMAVLDPIETSRTRALFRLLGPFGQRA